MATIWLTYAWADNAEGGVDFIAQELICFGVKVKLDRWNIGAGRRLWEQVENFICDPSESDAWVLYATANSLGSQPCKEELAYALDRALTNRGDEFPVIGLFPASVDRSLISASIKTRLYVSLADPLWKERIKSAAERRPPSIPLQHIDPYFIRIHTNQGGIRYSIELRPRAGTWSPFIAGVPLQEKEKVKPSIMFGPTGRVVSAGVLFGYGQSISNDNKWWVMWAQNEATPTQSYYVNCDDLPSKLLFGVYGGQPQYNVDASRLQASDSATKKFSTCKPA